MSEVQERYVYACSVCGATVETDTGVFPGGWLRVRGFASVIADDGPVDSVTEIDGSGLFDKLACFSAWQAEVRSTVTAAGLSAA